MKQQYHLSNSKQEAIFCVSKGSENLNHYQVCFHLKQYCTLKQRHTIQEIMDVNDRLLVCTQS